LYGAALCLVLLACITACDSSSDDPPAQATVTLQAQADSADEVTLEWETTAGGVTGFRIERAEGSGDFEEIAQAGETDTTYTDTGLSAGATYSYRVWAVCADGDIACSAGVEVTTPNAITLTALAVSTSGIDLSWEYSGDDEEGFRVERKTAGTDFAEVAEVGAGQDSYSDTGLGSGTSYTYRVCAFDADGDILCSPEASATTQSPAPPASGAVIADHTSIDLDEVPSEWIEEAKAALHIAYGHTSHGSQITTGMTGLVGFMGDAFTYNSGGTGGALDLRDTPFSGASDLGNPDREAWEAATRDYLDDHPEVNVIMWSWCGQVSSATEEDIDTYLDLMSGLEDDYADVSFVYMTGHLDGQGLTGNLHLRNEQIRDYCRAHDKVLYDFADIESYDPDGVYYGDRYADDACRYDSNGNGHIDDDDANWAQQWQAAHTQGVDWYACSSAHSEAVNANMKAYAAWWLWARLAGWDGQ
jgi:fibronectin type 3 domain-containing protein